MAGQEEILATIKKMRDSLTCGICMGTLTFPVSIPCHHVFCESCLLNLLDNNTQFHDSVCPLDGCSTPFWEQDIKLNKRYRSIVDSITNLWNEFNPKEVKSVSADSKSVAVNSYPSSKLMDTQDLDRAIFTPPSAAHAKHNVSEPAVLSNRILKSAKSDTVRFISFTSLLESEHITLTNTLNLLGNASISVDNCVNFKTTHLVAKTDENYLTKRTIKYMQALMRRIWIVSMDWIIKSKESGKWLQESQFEIKGDTNVLGGFTEAPSRSLLSITGFFSGFQFVLLDVPTLSKEPTIDQMRDLILMGGGEIVPLQNAESQMKNNSFVIVSSSCSSSKFKFIWPIIAPSWLVSSVCSYKIEPIEPYRIIL